MISCKTYKDDAYPEKKNVRVDNYRTNIYLRETADGSLLLAPLSAFSFSSCPLIHSQATPSSSWTTSRT